MLQKILLVSAQLFSVQALQVYLSTRPATTNTISTLYLTIEADPSLPWKPTGIKIKTPTLLSSTMGCQVTKPSTLAIISCKTSISTSEIDIKFQTELTETTYLQISGFLTPSSTSYTGFNLTTYDGQGYTLESAKGLKLASLAPLPLQATLGQKSTRLSEMTTSEIEVSSAVQCQDCQLELQGPGLANATCLGCLATSTGIKLRTGMIYGQKYLLNVENVQNPTTFDGSLYKLQLKESGGVAQESEFSITASDPSLLTNLQAKITGSTEVKKITNVQLSFQVPVSLQAGCTVDLIVPDDFTDLKEFMWQISAVGIFSPSSPQRQLQFTVLDQSLIRIKDACLQQTVSGVVTLELSFVRNPSIVKETGSFKVTINDSQDRQVCISTDSFTIIGFTPSNLKDFKVTLDPPTVQSQTSATFEILPQNSLQSEGFIVIMMPNSFNLIAPSLCISLNIVATKEIVTCTLIANAIKISNLFYSAGYDPITDQSIKIRVENLGSTSESVQSLQFQVLTYAGPDEPVDSSTFILSQLLQPGALQVDYLFSNDQANALSNLTLSLTLTSKLPAGGVIKVTMPKDILTPNQLQCIGLKGFSSPCQITTDLVIPIGPRLPGTKISFTLLNLRLPRYQGSLAQKIKVDTQSADGNIIDSDQSLLFVTNAQELTLLEVSSGSKQNSVKTWLSLQFTLPSEISLISEDQLIIQIPPEITLLNNTCLLMQVDYDCKFTTNNELRISSGLNLIQFKQILVEVSIINQKSFNPITGFQVKLVDKREKVLATTVTQVSYTTSVPSMLAVEMRQLSTVESELTQYQFKSNIPLGKTQITLADCMQFSEATLKDQLGLAIPFILLKQTQIEFTSQALLVMIDGLRNPSETCLKRQITLKTFDQAGYLEGSVAFTPSIACLSQCQSCLVTDRAHCTACSGSLSLIDGQCLAQCPLQLWSFQNKCMACATDCSECANLTTCRTCNKNKVLSLDGQCTDPDMCTSVSGHYIADNKCQNCEEPCIKCSETGECLECSPYAYLLNGQCVDRCPLEMKLEANVCSDHQTSEVIFCLFIRLPCTYLSVVIFMALFILKLLLKSRISFVMTNLVCVTSLMILVQAYVSFENFRTFLKQPDLIGSLTTFIPILCLVFHWVSNLWITLVHKIVLTVGGYRTVCCVYFPSLVFTYHCLSQAKLKKLTSSEAVNDEKMAKSMVKYLYQYSLVSKLNLHLCFLPTFFLLAWQAYQETESLSQDCCFMIVMAGFWLQLALYYPPEETIVKTYILSEEDSEVNESDYERNSQGDDFDALRLAKNSISIHMLKLQSRKQRSYFTDLTPQKSTQKSQSSMPTKLAMTSKNISLRDIELQMGGSKSMVAVTKMLPIVGEYTESSISSSSDFGGSFSQTKAVLQQSFEAQETTIDKTQDQMIVSTTNQDEEYFTPPLTITENEGLTKKRSLFRPVQREVSFNNESDV